MPKEYYVYSGPYDPLARYYYWSPDREPVGEADTFVGRLFGNYYDDALIPFWSQRDQRYANQGTVNALGNFALRLAASTLSEGIIRPIAAITSLSALPIATLEDVSVADVFTKNPINLLSDGINTLGARLAPLMLTEGFEQRSLGSQLSSPGQYIMSNVDAVGFLLGSIATFGLTNIATKGIAGLTRAASRGATLGASVLDTANFIASNAAATLSEASVEAQEVYKRLMDEANRYAEDPAHNPEVYNTLVERAEQAFNNVFLLNTATLAATNSVLLKTLSPLFKKVAPKAASSAFNLSLAEDTFVKDRFTSRIGKFFFDKGDPKSALARSVIAEVATNALEEDLQYTYANVHEQTLKPLKLYESVLASLNDFITQDLFSEDERLKATFLGGLLGGGVPLVTSAIGYGPPQEAKRYSESIKELNRTYDKFMANYGGIKDVDIYERGDSYVYAYDKQQDGTYKRFIVEQDGSRTFDADLTEEEYQQDLQRGELQKNGEVVVKGAIKVDNDGKPRFDAAKLATLIADQEVINETNETLMAALSAEAPDYVLKYLAHRALAPLIVQAHQTKTVDLLKEKLTQMGKDDPTLNQTVSFIDKVIERFDKVDDYIYPLFESEKANVPVKKRLGYNLATQISNLEMLGATIKAAIDFDFSKDTEKLAQKQAELVQIEDTLEKLNKDFNELIDFKTSDAAYRRLMDEARTASLTSFAVGMDKPTYDLAKKNVIRSKKTENRKSAVKSLLFAEALKFFTQRSKNEFKNSDYTKEDIAEILEEIDKLLQRFIDLDQPISYDVKELVLEYLEELRERLEPFKEQVLQVFREEEIFGENPISREELALDLAQEAADNIDEMLAAYDEAMALREVYNLMDVVANKLERIEVSNSVKLKSEEELAKEYVDQIVAPIEQLARLALEDKTFIDLPAIGAARAYFKAYKDVEEGIERVNEILELLDKAYTATAVRLAEAEKQDLQQALQYSASLGMELKDPVFGYFLAMDEVTKQEAVEALTALEKALGIPLKWGMQTALDYAHTKANLLSPIRDELLKAARELDAEKAYELTKDEKLKLLIQLAPKIDFLQLVARKSPDVTVSSFLKALETYYSANPEGVVPTAAQLYAALQLAIFASLDSEHNVFDDIAATKAPAGAGKTSVIIPAIIKALGLSPDEYVLMATTQKATELIRQQAASTHKIDTVSDLTARLEKGEINPNISVIFLDEAGALTKVELEALSGALAKYNQGGRNLKILMFYDPLQLGAYQGVSYVPLDSPSYALQAERATPDYKAALRGDNKAQSAQVATPFGIENLFRTLSPRAVFRANSYEITQLASFFKDPKKHPEKLSTTANFSVGQPSNEPFYGATTSPARSSIEQLVLASLRTGVKRSRMIIVDTLEKKQQYESMFDSQQVEVLSIEETRGLSADEAYIDIAASNTPQAFYTAITRARDYVHLVTSIPTEHTVDLGAKERNELSKRGTIKTEGRLEQLKNAAQKASQEATEPKKQEEEKKEQKREETVEEEEEDDGKDEPEAVESTSDDVFVPKFTTSESFGLLKENGLDYSNYPDDVYIARIAGKVHLLVKLSDNEYMSIAVLSETEYESFKKFSSIDASKLENQNATPSLSIDPSGKAVFDFSNAPRPVLVSSIRLDAELSNPFTFVFSSQHDNLDSEADFQALVDRVLRPIGIDPADAEVKVVIYDSSKSVARDFDHLPESKRPKIHRPYLVIKAESISPIFIPLRAKLATAAHTTALRALIGDLKLFEELVAKHLPHPYSKIKMGEVDPYGYHTFHHLVYKISTGEDIEFVVEKDAKGLLASYPKIPKSVIPQELVTVAKRIIEATSEQGSAQRELNALAKTNLLVTTPAGRLIVLRDYTYRGGATALNILGPRKFYTGSAVPYVKQLNDRLRDKLIAYLDSLKRRGKGDSARARVINNALQIKQGKLHYFTIADLEQIFIEGLDENGNYSNLSEGFGLLAPLPTSYRASVEESIGMFSHDLWEVRPNQVVLVKRSANAVKVKEALQPASPPSQEIVYTTNSLKKLISLSPSSAKAYEAAKQYPKEVLDEFVKSLGASSLEEAVALYFEASSALFVEEGVRREPITKLIKELVTKDSTKRAEWVMEQSFFATEVGQKAGKVASRDFTRAAIAIEMLGIDTSKINGQALFKILDFARSFPNKDERYAFFTRLLELTTLDNKEIIANATKVFATYGAALSKEVAITPLRIETLEDIIKAVEVLVQGISTYRQIKRASTVDTVSREALLDEFRTALTAGQGEEFIKDREDDLKKASLPTNLKELAKIAFDDTERAFIRMLEAQEPDFDMTDEEAQRYYESMIPSSFWDWLKNVIFSRKKTEALRFVDYLKLKTSEGRLAYGLFKNGVITLMRSEDNFVSKRVLRHEIFHKLFNEFLTAEERLKALQMATQRYGNLHPLILEEKLADEFSEYRRGKSFVGLIKELFSKFLRFLGFAYSSFNTLEDLFYLMDLGLLSSKRSKLEGERPMLFLGSKFDSVSAFEAARKEFMDTFNALNERTDRVFSFDEAVIKTIDVLDSKADLYEDEKLKKAVKTLVRDKDVLAGFLDKYFGASYLRQAKRRLKASEQEVESIDVEDEEASIASDIIDSESKDPEQTLSARVKQRLSSIAYYRGGELRYLDVSSAFNMLIPLVSGINVESLEEYILTLAKKLSPYYKGLSPDKPTSAKAALTYQVAKMLDKAIAALSRDINKKVSFRRDVFSSDIYAIVSSTKDVRTMSLQEALKADDVVVYYAHQRALHDLVKDITTYLKDYSYQDVAQAYKDYEVLNFVIGLHFATASSFKRNPVVATYSWNYGRYKTSYYEIPTQASKRVRESALKAMLVAFIRDNPQAVDKYRDKLAAFLNQTPSGQAMSDLKAFLEELSLKDFLVETLDSKDALKSLGKAAYHMLSDVSEELKQVEEGALSIEDIVGNQGSFIAMLAEAINLAGGITESHSYLKGDRSVAYAYTPASLQHEKANQVAGATDGHTAIVAGKIVTKDPFLAQNIFVTDDVPSKIYGHVVHDSIKSRSGSAVTPFKKEKEAKTHARNFVHGFLDVYKHSNGAYYIQFMPVPASRRNVEGFKVTFLDEANLKKAIRMTLIAQKKRPKVNDPVYEKNAQYYIFAGIPANTRVDSLSVEEATSMVLKHVEENAAALAKELFDVENPLPLDIDKVHFAANQLNVYSRGEKTIADLQDELSKLYASGASKEDTKKKRDEIRKKAYQVAHKLLRLYYLNYAVNLYHLSAWVYGDIAFYSSKENFTKRIQISTSPGNRPLVDDVYGLPKTFKALYFEDPVVRVGDEVPRALESTKDSLVEITDSNAYMLPEFYERFAIASSVEHQTDIVLKPVYAGFEEGTYARKLLKFSVVVLTDEFVSKFPTWAAIRDTMRQAGADILVPKSAAKAGAPAKMLKFDRKGNLLNKEDIKEATHVLYTRFLRINLNLATEVENTTAFPVQAPAVINSSGLNTDITQLTYLLQAKIVATARRALFRHLRLTAKGTATPRTLKILSRILQKNAADIPGYEDVHYLLTNDNAGRALNLPIIADKLVSLLASTVSSSSVTIRMRGSKLVLQSDFGTYEYIDEDGNLRKSLLAFKDNKLDTEAFVPDTYYELLEKSGGSAVAFRIPISNFHSILSLKAKGKYPVPKGSHGNMIIPSSLHVYYQGSDHDGDTLFTISLEPLSEDMSLNDLLRQVDESLAFEGGDFTFKEGDFVGIKDGEIHEVNGVNIVFALDKALKFIDAERDFRRSRLYRLSKLGKHPSIIQAIVEENLRMSQLNQVSERLESFIILASKNQIVHLYQKALRKDDVLKDLLTPITFDAVNRTQKDTELLGSEGVIPFKEGMLSVENIAYIGTAHLRYALKLVEQGKSPSFLATLKEIETELHPAGEFNDYLVQLRIKYNSDAGSGGIGIAANTLKSAGMLLESTPPTKLVDASGKEITPTVIDSYNPSYRVLEREPVLFKDKYHVRIHGQRYTGITREVTNIDGNPTGVNVFEIMDTIENLAIDEVKEGRMFILGINNANASAFLVPIIMGVPLNYVTLIFTHPRVVSLYENNSYVNEEVVKQAFSTEQLPNVSREDLEKYFGISTLDELDKASLRVDMIVEPDKFDKNLVLLNELILGNTLSKFITIGKELFFISSILRLIKNLPGTKAGIDTLLDRVFTLFDIADLNVKDRVKAAIDEAAKTYLKGLGESEEITEKKIKELQASKAYALFLDSVVSSTSINQAIRASSYVNTKPSGTSVFENANLLHLPQVGAAVSSLLFLSRIIEEAFPLYSPLTRKLASSVFKRSEVFALPREFYAKVKELQVAIFRALTSNLHIEFVDGTRQPLFFEPSYTYVDANGVLYKGNEAFAKEFSDTIFRLMEYRALVNSNAFFAALESHRGVLGISLDKLKNEEITERIREGYEELWAIKPELAFDFFRYAVITTGLFFTRSSFARVFPKGLINAYAAALERRLSQVFATENPIATQSVLSSVEDAVLLQYLRLSKDSLRYINVEKSKPLVTGTRVASNNKKEDTHAGYEQVDGRKIFFDIMFSNVSNPPKFIRRWANDPHIYGLIATHSGKAYYRIVARQSSSFFEVDTLNTADNVDLSKILNADIPIMPSSYVVSSRGLITLEYPMDLEKGFKFYVLDLSDINPTSLKQYEVVEKRGNIYTIRPTKEKLDVSVADKFASEYKGSEIMNFLTLSSHVELTTAREAVDVAQSKRDGFSIVSDYDAENGVIGDVIVPLSRHKELSEQAFLQLVNDTLRSVNFLLQSRNKIYIAQDFLDKLISSNNSLAKAVARLMFTHLRWAHPIIREEVLDDNASTVDRIYHLLSLVDYVSDSSGVVIDENRPSEVRIDKSSLSKISSTQLTRVQKGILIALADNNFGYVLEVEDKTLKVLILDLETASLLTKKVTPLNELEVLLDKKVKQHCA